MTNWLPDTNPYYLPKPPAWWLQLLHDQDSALVVFPSRLGARYILARRRSASLGMPALVKVDADLLRITAHGDGDVLANHNLVAVDSIINTNGNWTTAIFAQLRARDIWDAGGGDAYTDRIELAEGQLAAKKRADMLDDIDQRAIDSYHSLQARTGQRNQRAGSGAAKIVHVGNLSNRLTGRFESL